MANSGNLWLNRIVNTVDRDPEIKRFEKLSNLKESDLAVLAGLSGSTVKNIFSGGKTKRPQRTTFAKMAGALGYKYDLVPDGKPPDFDKEIPKAREEFKAYRATLAKKKEHAAKRANGHAKKGRGK
jgi:transcriptional regulator with XRE-family HTH domain